MESSDEISDKHTLLEDNLLFRWCRRINSSWWRRIFVTACVMSVLVNLAVLRYNYYHRSNPTLITPTDVNRTSWVSLFPQRIEKFEKPKEFRIVGLVFAGRRDRLSILDCYLRVR